jgi:DNA-binding response OmpR family regulator
MLTARRQEQDIVTALELGANDYLVKPFIPEELVARLARLLEGSAR